MLITVLFCWGYRNNNNNISSFALCVCIKKNPLNLLAIGSQISLKKNPPNWLHNNLLLKNNFAIMKSRTKSTSSTALTSTKATAPCDSSKHYPSISAAYWLPAPNTTPYMLPGMRKNFVFAVYWVFRKSRRAPAKVLVVQSFFNAFWNKFFTC